MTAVARLADLIACPLGRLPYQPDQVEAPSAEDQWAGSGRRGAPLPHSPRLPASFL